MSLGQRPRVTNAHEPALKARLIQKRSSAIVPSMPQSSSKVIFHIIFSTKDRHPWLDANVRPRMHAYLATVCRDAGAKAFRVGGVADHVHLVATLPRTLSQADMLEGLKKKSSKWIKGLAPDYRHLYWQRGYGAFSVSPSQANSTPSSNMWRPRKNTIAAPPSRKSTTSSCTNTALSMTSVMRGIEAALVESRFQRSFQGVQYSWGVAPGW